MRHLPLRLLVLLLLTASAFPAAAHPLVIGIAGDSTVADYAADSVQRGWGQLLPRHFDSSVTVVNLAKNGRSTKTFLSEGLWAELLAKKPDYVLIQFGHNDSHAPDHPEHTDAQGDYKTLLARFVDETRAQGAVPILVTPVQRRTATDGLIPYSDAMKEVARGRHVLLLDLHALSGQLYARLGTAQIERLAMPGDQTHFSTAGAAAMADIVVTELVRLVPELSGRLAPTGAAARPVTLFPASGATEVNPDTLLRVHLDHPAAFGSGTVEIRDSATAAVIATIDLAQGPLTETIGGLPDFRYNPVTLEGNDVVLHLQNGLLTYGKRYTVVVAPGAIDEFGGTAGSPGWSFTTKASPPPASQPRVTVAADGSGDFSSVQGAIDAIPEGNHSPVTVFVRKGTYPEIVVLVNRDNVSIVGEDRAGTVIAYPNNEKFNGAGGNPYATGANPSAALPHSGHIYHRGVLLAHRVNRLTLANLTIRNTTPHGGSQAEAIILNGTLDAHAIVRDVDLSSFQDTLQINGQAYIANTHVEGDVDFLWGTGPSFFTGCSFHSVKSDAYYTQIRNPASNHGFVFDHCVFDGAAGVTGDYLSRIEPNRFPASEVVLLNCVVGANVAPAAWFLQEPKGTSYPVDRLHFWEHASVDAGGKPLDFSQRLPGSRRLYPASDAKVIARYADPAFVLGGWDPRREPARQ